MEITIWGVLTGAALPLFGYLAFHWLATEREKQSRYAQACNEYRQKIIQAVSVIPESNVHWDNASLEAIPELLNSIEVAVEVFKHFLPKNENEKLKESHKEFKELVNSQIPEALSVPNVMYGGGKLTPSEAREEFWIKVEELKKYANKT